MRLSWHARMFVLIVSQAEFSQYGGRGKKVWTLTAVAMVLDSEELHQRAIGQMPRSGNDRRPLKD